MGPEHFSWDEWWLFPIIMFLAMVVIFLVMFYFVFWRSGFRPPRWNDSIRPSSRPKDSETAIEILKKRYAKGEISREEFEQLKKKLQG